MTAAFALAVGVLIGPLHAEPPKSILARVDGIHDGATLRVKAKLKLKFQRGSVRLADSMLVEIAGIHAPNLWQPRCEAERRRAIAGKQLLEKLAGDAVVLRSITTGPYAGRVAAQVYTRDGQSLAAALIDAGFARPAMEDTQSPGWC